MPQKDEILREMADELAAAVLAPVSSVSTELLSVSEQLVDERPEVADRLRELARRLDHVIRDTRQLAVAPPRSSSAPGDLTDGDPA